MASSGACVVGTIGATAIIVKLGLAQVAVPTQFPVWIVVIAIVLLIMLMRASSSNRRNALGDQRLCRGCGTSHPRFAVFCRRCGRRL
jgi:ribosomal protein L40E